jgi:D-beta-D-heptose 7-phosphate kinase/D-beta-D-heptose 1-phosphate adenosyltransferase
MTQNLAVVSGGFDPVHSGHVAMINEAAKLGIGVIILLNSDAWLTRKKGKPFMPFLERQTILQNFKNVLAVIDFDDSDNTAIAGLEEVKRIYPEHNIIFCNGGDRTKENIPEMSVEGIEFKFGIGGEHKANSSSWILRDAVATYTEDRVWGKFADLYTTTGCKVKELVIKPGKGISYQRHKNRSEVWFVRSGKGVVRYSSKDDPLNNYALIDIYKNDVFVVRQGQWHQLYNESKDDLNIIEIQYGSETSESDIERIEYYSK